MEIYRCNIFKSRNSNQINAHIDKIFICNSVEIKYYYQRIYPDNENVMAIVKILPEVAAELNSSYV